MIVERPRSENYAHALDDLGWTCHNMVFSWLGSPMNRDAAELFTDLFGCDAKNAQRNKFPTASMPCRSWARGVSDGLVVDLTLGEHDTHSRLHVSARSEGETLQGALVRFSSLLQQLEATFAVPLQEGRCVLDLQLSDKADHARFMQWLGLQDWQAQSLLYRQECVFSLAQGRIDGSVSASLDRRTGSAGLQLGVAQASGLGLVRSVELFDNVYVLLSAGRIADLVSL